MAEVIEVNSNPVPAQLMSLLRDTLKLVGAGLITKGAIGATTWEIVTGLVIAATPIIWSQIVVRLKKKESVILAEAAPNSVAVVK